MDCKHEKVDWLIDSATEKDGSWIFIPKFHTVGENCNEIFVEAKCADCGAKGYDVYKASRFEVKEEAHDQTHRREVIQNV